MKVYFTKFFVSFLLFLLLSTSANAKEYYTLSGIEPDKWASVWLIKRFVDRNAAFSFEEEVSDIKKQRNGSVSNKVFFGTTESRLERQHKKSLMQVLISHYKVSNPSAKKLGSIIDDIEINTWNVKQEPFTNVLEIAIRKMQKKYNNRDVPLDCYFRIFDTLDEALRKGRRSLSVQSMTFSKECPGSRKINKRLYIDELPLKELLRLSALGANIAFVDTREYREYTEERIPGAKHLPLRQLSSQKTIQSLQGYDLVIPYCVKDFRAFEVAKKLKENGINQVKILKPYGLKGWKKSGLPTEGKNGVSKKEALQRLKMCAIEPHKCLR